MSFAFFSQSSAASQLGRYLDAQGVSSQAREIVINCFTLSSYRERIGEPLGLVVPSPWFTRGLGGRGGPTDEAKSQALTLAERLDSDPDLMAAVLREQQAIREARESSSRLRDVISGALVTGTLGLIGGGIASQRADLAAVNAGLAEASPVTGVSGFAEHLGSVTPLTTASAGPMTPIEQYTPPAPPVSASFASRLRAALLQALVAPAPSRSLESEGVPVPVAFRQPFVSHYSPGSPWAPGGSQYRVNSGGGLFSPALFSRRWF